MTRETKIGLLVGLAFIIVIGILLGESGRVEPAELRAVGDNIRASAAAPHNGTATRDEVVAPPPPVTPSRAVATQAELHPETHIEVRPGVSVTPGPAIVVGGPSIVHGPAAEPGVRADPGPGAAAVAINEGADTGIPPGLARVAREGGEELTNSGSHGTPPAPSGPAVPNTAGMRQYTVEAGDTLNKLAGRFLGGNTKANREAIIAVNPTLKQNPNNLVVGKTYAIPTAKPAVAVAAPPAAPPAVAAHPPVFSNGPQYWYVVKENDNLWRIAASQLGDGNAWASIKELNKDILKGRDEVHPRMRLRLPAKPIASAE